MPRFSPSRWFLGPSQVSRSLTPELTSEYPTCHVCVYVRIHTHTTLYTPNSVNLKNRESTDRISIFPLVNNKVPLQHRLAESPRTRPPMLINKLCIHERTCTPCGWCISRYVNWCHKKSVQRTYVHMRWCWDTYLVHATLNTKKAHLPAREMMYCGSGFCRDIVVKCSGWGGPRGVRWSVVWRWYEHGFEMVIKGLGQSGLSRAPRLGFYTLKCPLNGQTNVVTILRGRETVGFNNIYLPWSRTPSQWQE